RLSLRADNAGQRLTPLGLRLGIVSSERAAHFERFSRALDKARALARSIVLTPQEAARRGLTINQDGVRRSGYELLSYENVDIAWLDALEPAFHHIDRKTAEALEIEAKYAVYMERQRVDVARIQAEESKAIPYDLDFGAVPGLS